MNDSLAPAVLCLTATGVMLAALRMGRPALAAGAKLIASSAFVWAAIAWGAQHSTYGQVLLGGLVLSWFGDALLIPAGTSTSFRLGIGAFLLAHVAFAIAFLLLPLSTAALVTAAIGCLFAGRLILRWLWPHLRSGMRAAVTGYVVTIMFMTTFAIAATAGSGPVAVAFGAVAFAISDLTVARDRFIQPGFVNRLSGLPLYYCAQLLLASSVARLAG